MEKSNPEVVYFVKNSGDFIVGIGKQNNEIVVTSERSLFAQEEIKERFHAS
tara:strand:+ start:942 stop:1094 length:153 start_codon:yes stop_codon:yes gene_type:complete